MNGGRGRERTMPSWITKKPNNTDTTGSGSSDRELDRNMPEKTRQMGMNASHGEALSAGSSRQISSTSSSNGAASAGRGRGMTAPAWMTRNSSNNDHDTTTDARRDSKYHEGDGGKGAVGRGRGMTEPSWMTINSSNTEHDSSTDNQRNAATNKPSRELTKPVGLVSIGRGRGATTPAWMTQKCTSVNNSSAERQRSPMSAGVSREPRSADNGTMDRRHNANVPQRSTHQAASGRPVGTPGIGRGRGATTPAWMTKMSANAEEGCVDNTRSRSDVSREREQPAPNNNVNVRRGNQDFTNAGRNISIVRGYEQTPSKSVSEGNHCNSHACNSRDYPDRSYSDQTYNSRNKTGRNHHDVNTMQSREWGQDNGGYRYRDHRNNESHSSNFSSDRDAGRTFGRGKDINRPAWMSKN